MDFSQLQGQQQQQQQQQQLNHQQQQQYHQAQATINRDKSIVVKTLPDNVIDEFRNANISRQQRAGGQPAAAFNPFAQDEQQPLPVQQQTFEQQPMQSFAEQQPVMQRAQAPPPPLAVAQVAPAVDPREQEVKQLVGIVSGCLRKELESGSRTPVTIGVLSSKIKNLTGKSWGGYWQENHGQLTQFIKQQPQHFVLYRNKYVVLIGHENDVDIPTDNPLDKLSVSKGANGSVVRRDENKKATASSTASAALSSSVSASQMRASAAQSYKPILPMEATTGLMFPSSAPQQQQPGYGMYGNQQQQPMYNQQQQYGQQQPNMYNNSMQQGQQPVNGGYPVAPQQQQQMFGQPQPTATPSASQGSFDPFAAPVSVSAGGALAAPPAADDWWSQGGGASGGDNNAHLEWASPLEGFEDTSGSSHSNAKAQSVEDEDEDDEEDEAVSAKDTAERERERKEQERKDEEFAKQLQEQEYASQGGSSSTPRSPREQSVQPIKGSYVTLPAAQIRDLAEKEIGKENIRILARFSVKKYGREGRPHQRKMWVTAGLTHLAWDSTHSDGARRGVQFSQVSEIMVGYRTPTIERWTKDPRKVALCFSLVTPSRTLDLQACSVIQRDELVAALRKVVKFNRRHKPKMIDRWTTQILIED